VTRGRASFIAVLTVLAALAAQARADEAGDARKSPPMPFEAGEQLVYEGEFSRFVLRGIKIAEFRFTAGRDASETKGEPAGRTSPRLSFVGDVQTEGWFHRLFKIDFHFRLESLVERDTFSVLKTTRLDEQGKRVRTSETVFDREARVISWTEVNPKEPQSQPRVVNAPLEGRVLDILSAIYYLRTQPLVPGKSFELTLSDSGQVFRVPVAVAAEPKPLKTAVGKVSVVRLDLELFGEGRPLEGTGTMSMWVTTDSRRLPVRARLSSELGQLDIKIKKYSAGPR
jgi:hypothetical protein